MKGSVNVRELSLEALLSIEREEAYSHVVISGILDKYNYLEAQEKAFIKCLTEGTLERRIEIDHCIDLFSKTPVKKMKPLIRELLRMSVYQILFMNGIPDSAVCNEAVKLAERHSFRSLKGFVNGVLRSICRNKDNITYPDRKEDETAYLSVRYSMPRWIVEKWEKEQGGEKTERILQGLLEKRPVTVRLRQNMTAADREKIKTELRERGIEVTESRLLPYAWELEKSEGLKNIPAFAAGKFTVQDISSMLAVEAAGIQPGDLVMDVCAAPGGKMLFAGEKTGPDGSVVARDVSRRRLERMEENRLRMGGDNITLEQWDATVLDETYLGRADVVLADVPCSGLGVIGKKRDIKYRASGEAIESLRLLQRQILGTVWQYVRPGGVLLYSTCTINRAENEEMADWFLERFPFHGESLRPFLPDSLSGRDGSHVDGDGEGAADSPYIQLLPGVHDTDGFFVARFVRDRFV